MDASEFNDLLEEVMLMDSKQLRRLIARARHSLRLAEMVEGLVREERRNAGHK